MLLLFLLYKSVYLLTYFPPDCCEVEFYFFLFSVFVSISFDDVLVGCLFLEPFSVLHFLMHQWIRLIIQFCGHYRYRSLMK